MDSSYIARILKNVKKRKQLEVGIDCTYFFDKIRAICCKIHDENIMQIAK